MTTFHDATNGTIDELISESYGVTYPSRPQRRVDGACGNCRRKKARCSGERPTCKTCHRLGHKCVYGGAPVRRTSNRQESVLGAASFNDGNVLPNIGEMSPESLAAQLNRIESSMSDIRKALLTLSPAIERGETSLDSSGSTVESHAAAGIESPTGEASHVDAEDAQMFRGLLPFATVLNIIDVYFTYCHNQPYSFFHQSDFRQRLKDGLIPDHLLFAILASAARFSKDPFFKDNPIPIAETYAKRSWNAIVSQVFAGGEQPTFSTLQSITLLGIFDFTAGHRRHGSAWVKIGMSIRIAQDLRLMLDEVKSPQFSYEEERRRTFWSIYLLDQLVACGRGRPPGILPASCQVQLPCDEDAWRSGRHQRTETLESFSNRRLSEYALQDYNIRSQQPPWDSSSDHSSIQSDLMYLESHFELGQPLSQIIQRATGLGNIDQAVSGPIIFTQALFCLGNCLLHHPFLIRRRLELTGFRAAPTFLSRTFETGRQSAVRMTQILYNASRQGCIVLTSFYGYCTVVAATIHALHAHSTQDFIAQESLQLLQTTESILDGLSQYFVNCCTIRDAFRLFVANSIRYCCITDTLLEAPTLDANDTERLWAMLDYSTLSSAKPSDFILKTSTPTNSANFDMIDYSEQWVDLFNSIGVFRDDPFASAHLGLAYEEDIES